MKKIEWINILIIIIVISSAFLIYQKIIGNYHVSSSNVTEQCIQTSNANSSINVDNIKILFKDKLRFHDDISNKVSDWRPISGKWSIKDNHYFGENSQSIEGGTGLLNMNQWENFSIEFNVKSKDTTQKGFFSFGLIFRYKSGNYYYLTALYDRRGTANANEIGFGKVINGVPIWIKRDYTQVWKPDVTYKIKVIATDYTLKAHVDDVKTLDAMSIDSEIGKGSISFSSYYSSAEFSDISITNITGYIYNLPIYFDVNIKDVSNLSVIPSLVEKQLYPSNFVSYSHVYSFNMVNYSNDRCIRSINESLNISLPLDLIRPPNIIYFPTEPYNRTFAIRLIARGWDEQNQEWVFKEFMSPEFTWEDVVEGRTIAADGSRE